MFPGVAVSLLLGNVFYGWQAKRLAAREGRDDVTALPYGINTPSLLIYVFAVMAPEYARTGDPAAGWRAGLVACFGSGVIELLGAVVAGPVRRWTPRAALLATLAGIAVGFISMSFALGIYGRPLIGLVPMVVVLAAMLSGVRFPGGVPGGLLAVAAGTGVAWLATAAAQVTPLGEAAWMKTSLMDPEAVRSSMQTVGLYLPRWCGGELWAGLSDPDRWLSMVTVILPMGLFNLVGSLQNLESAEAAGDTYAAGPSLAANGLGTIAASLFGSCFPTTIYIGHPGWKSLGSGAGYSILNGVAVTLLCAFGLVGLLGAVVPIEAGAAIILWIGVVITAQAFSAVPKEHYPAVALALFPAIAAFGATVFIGTVSEAGGKTIAEMLTANAGQLVNGFLVHGLLLMERGFIFTCVVWGAIAVALREQRFRTAAVWCGIAAALTFLGMMHSYVLPEAAPNTPDSLWRFQSPPTTGGPPAASAAWRADDVAAAYLAAAGLLLLPGRRRRGGPGSPLAESPAAAPR